MLSILHRAFGTAAIRLTIYVAAILPVHVAAQSPGPAPKQDNVEIVNFPGTSVGLYKIHYEEFRKSGALPSFLPAIFLRGTITKRDIPIFLSLFAPYLGVHVTNAKLPDWVAPNEAKTSYTVFLDSPGGDIDAALIIGRIIRKGKGRTLVGKDMRCISACVFLLAAGVYRDVVGKVEVHRPYTQGGANRTYEQLQSDLRSLENRAQAYLSEMNVPDSLYAHMKRISPEYTETLSPADIDRYQLDSDDPVFVEYQDNGLSRRMGISKSELLQRKQAFAECNAQGLRALVDSGEQDILATIRVTANCKMQFLDAAPDENAVRDFILRSSWKRRPLRE